MFSVESHAKGHATTADTLGYESILINPAGLKYQSNPSIYTSISNPYGFNTQLLHIGSSFSINEINIAIGLPLMSIQNIDKTDALNDRGIKTGSFSDQSGTGILAASYQLVDSITIASSLKYHFHSLESATASGTSLDFGMLYTSPYGNIGLSAQNVVGTSYNWSTGHSESFKKQVNIGLSSKSNEFGQINIDIHYKGKQDTNVNIGYEYEIDGGLTLFSGLQDTLQSMRLHTGATLNLFPITIMYSFEQHPILETAHRFGMSYEI